VPLIHVARKRPEVCGGITGFVSEAVVV
jgi:hypothetical protein